jgi:hypothetical protein
VLAADVFPKFRKLYDIGHTEPFDHPNSWKLAVNGDLRGWETVCLAVEDPIYDKVDEDIHGYFSILRDALMGWTDRFSLNNEWFLEVALYTMNDWCENPEKEGADWPELGPVLWHREVGFRFEFPSWEPSVDTWRSYHKRIVAAFHQRIEAYRKSKMDTTPEEALAREKHEEMHFVWFVEFQINEKSMAQIAREYGNVDRSTVSEAVRCLAPLLGLHLRGK